MLKPLPTQVLLRLTNGSPPSWRPKRKHNIDQSYQPARRELMSTQVVSHQDWLAARERFLKKEKQFTRLRDELSRERRELPRERVEKNYIFEGPNGKVSLADLFDGRSQLIVYHFMFGPDWAEGCPSCSF